MSDFLESVHKKQRMKIREQNPRRGNFVQLNTWFGDVWAEVESAYINPDRESHDFVMLYEGGRRE